MQLSQETMAEDPGATRRILLKRAMAKITLQDAEFRAEKVKALPSKANF